MEKKEEIELESIEEILNKPLPEPNGFYYQWEGWPKITAEDLQDYQRPW